MKAALLLPVLVLAMVGSSFAGNNADDPEREWQTQRERDYLLDQEKNLQRDSDDLGYEVSQLKSEIIDLTRKLEMAQAKLDRVRHSLITVQMKLIR